ncbi:hypothetical protein pb186bvf_010419 [Paramecium bursaria]
MSDREEKTIKLLNNMKQTAISHYGLEQRNIDAQELYFVNNTRWKSKQPNLADQLRSNHHLHIDLIKGCEEIFEQQDYVKFKKELERQSVESERLDQSFTRMKSLINTSTRSVLSQRYNKQPQTPRQLPNIQIKKVIEPRRRKSITEFKYNKNDLRYQYRNLIDKQAVIIKESHVNNELKTQLKDKCDKLLVILKVIKPQKRKRR